MGTHDVTLPANIRPVFPPRCVGCELEHPTGTARISVTGAHSGPSVAEVAVDAALGSTSRPGTNKRVTVHVPACPACIRKLEWRHFWKTVFLYGGALGGVALGVLVIAATSSGVLGTIVILAGVVSPVIWELVSPPEFTMTPTGGTTTYEFRSPLCAKEFSDANPVTGAPPKQSALL